MTLYIGTDIISAEVLLSVKDFTGTGMFDSRKICDIADHFVHSNKLHSSNLEGESVARFPFILLIILQSNFPKNLI